MIFRESLKFLLVFLLLFATMNLARFFYVLWPSESFLALVGALMYALYRFCTWLLSAGGPR
jgi:hypothetical protein